MAVKGFKIKDLFRIDRKSTKGLLPVEWAILAYTVFTLILIMLMFTRLHDPQHMLVFRAQVVGVMVVMWGVYRMAPCPLMMIIRVAAQVAFLAEWYPDTYEFNRCFENLDHIFCALEQSVFGCQPSILFSELLPWGIVSEPLDLGYFSYYPIIAFTTFFYFLFRKENAQRCAFVLMGAFFLFYVVFIFVPVAGPTFYFKAVGIDTIQQGVYPAIGHYFENHQNLAGDCLPSPGWTGGIFWNLVEVAKWAGERPTAAFPSSHVGVTTVCMLLLWYTRNRKVFFCVLPFAVLMFFATFYIQAHYAIDAVAGLISGALIFSLLYFGYPRIFKKG